MNVKGDGNGGYIIRRSVVEHVVIWALTALVGYSAWQLHQNTLAIVRQSQELADFRGVTEAKWADDKTAHVHFMTREEVELLLTHATWLEQRTTK